MKPNHNYITNPIFILSLIALLSNDFYLKEIYHNWGTGKLSDITGIIVFAFFLTAIRSDLKKHIFIVTAILFAFWKSETSQILIDSWNSLNILQVDRIVDYTDILCIIVLIPLYWYLPKSLLSKVSTKKLVSYPIMLLTLFAIVATSRARHIPADTMYLNEYFKVNSTKDFFLKQLEKNKVKYTITDSILIIKKDTLNRIILKDIIINQDTIYSASVGILDKGNRLKVYVESLKISKNMGYNLMDIKEYKRWSKKYRIETKEFMKGIKE